MDTLYYYVFCYLVVFFYMLLISGHLSFTINAMFSRLNLLYMKFMWIKVRNMDYGMVENGFFAKRIMDRYAAYGVEYFAKYAMRICDSVTYYALLEGDSF